MRIDELALLAFGPFTQKRLDFSSGREGLHLVYGPNEAGKSSALRALRDALFGIPARTTDSFLHDNSALRIGLTLRAADGSRLELLRRKGNSKTLLDPRTEKAIDESKLTRLLSGVGRETYESMFGIDYGGLVAGGEQIAELKGQVGATLFAAAGGITHLRELQQTLDKAGERLFKAGGSNPELNAAIREYQATHKELKERRVASKEFDQLESAIKKSRDSLQQLDAQLHAVRAQRDRLDKLRRALPQWAKRRRLREQLAEHESTRSLRANFDREFREARQRLQLEEQIRRQAEQRRQELDAKCAQLDGPPLSASLRAERQTLANDLGSHRKAQKDLPKVRRDHDAVAAEAQLLLQRLRPGLALRDAETLRIPQELQERISQLADEYQKNRTLREELAQTLQSSQEQLAAAEHEERSLAMAADLRELQSTVRSIEKEGRLEKQLAELQTKVARGRSALERQLKQLGRWAGGLERLDEPLPSLSTISLHEARISEAEQAVREEAQQQARFEKERQALAGQLATLLATAGELPTDADLAAARGDRDRLWQAVRRAWERGAPPTAEQVAERYEHSVAAADKTVDRMRQEQQRVVTRMQLDAELARRTEDLAASAGRLAVLKDELAARQSEWSAIWTPLQIEAATPTEMREWRTGLEQIRERQHELRGMETDATELHKRIESALMRLRAQVQAAAALLPAGVGSLDGAASLEDALQVCGTLLEQQAELAKKRVKVQANREQHQKQVEENTRKLARLERTEQEWRTHWSACVQSLGFDADSPPTKVLAYAHDVRELQAKWQELYKGTSGFAIRIEGIEADAKAFSDRVQRLGQAVGIALPPGQETPVESLAQQILDALDQADRLDANLQELRDQQRKAVDACAVQDQAVSAAQIRLQSLCEEAGDATPEQLDELWQRSEQRRELLQQLEMVEEALQGLSGGRSIADWEREASAADESQLAVEIERLDRDIESLDAQRGELQKELGRLASERQKLDGGTQVVELNAKLQSHLGRIETLTIEYARTRLASYVLRKAIDRFGEQNQAPMLRRASDYFAQLTEGSFVDLKIDYNDDDEPILVGRRKTMSLAGEPVERTVRVEGMSEGTADQLYFAMRLAYLAEWQDKHEPLPIVVDDILIKFDDPRALATLRVLGEFSRRTQVIVFTHHQHLVELARAHLPDDVLHVQQLDR
ncbi:MAG: AAA family ATPase [Pirellulales bacterium]